MAKEKLFDLQLVVAGRSERAERMRRLKDAVNTRAKIAELDERARRYSTQARANGQDPTEIERTLRPNQEAREFHNGALRELGDSIVFDKALGRAEVAIHDLNWFLHSKLPRTRSNIRKKIEGYGSLIDEIVTGLASNPSVPVQVKEETFLALEKLNEKFLASIEAHQKSLRYRNGSERGSKANYASLQLHETVSGALKKVRRFTPARLNLAMGPRSLGA